MGYQEERLKLDDKRKLFEEKIKRKMNRLQDLNAANFSIYRDKINALMIKYRGRD